MWRWGELFHLVSGHLNVDPFTLNQKSFKKNMTSLPSLNGPISRKRPLLDEGGVVRCQGWLGIRPCVLHCGWQHSALIHTEDRKKKKRNKQNKTILRLNAGWIHGGGGGARKWIMIWQRPNYHSIDASKRAVIVQESSRGWWDSWRECWTIFIYFRVS